MICLCIPTLNRYDLLPKLIESAENGIAVPDRYLIIDNGCALTFDAYQNKVKISSFGKNIGVAASWNKFIKDTWEYGDRIISNDDVIFTETTIDNLLKSPGDFIFATSRNDLNAFSLFRIKNSCVEQVGYFDEGISPNYAYFEDNDYSHRMSLAGVDVRSVRDDVIHGGSSTIRHFNTEQKKEHDRKFQIARTNYVHKWGGTPGNETFRVPYNGAGYK